ncbi:MAG: hypothetical protein ACKVVP_21885 [Chloroflexota bacterium]
MDALTAIAFIGFFAQVLMWLGLPDRTAVTSELPVAIKTKVMAA